MPEHARRTDTTGSHDAEFRVRSAVRQRWGTTFESVREKIETRYGTALGATELDAESPQGRRLEDQYAQRQRAAAERLAQIRESMHTDE